MAIIKLGKTTLYLLKSYYIRMLQGPVIHYLPLHMFINLSMTKNIRNATQPVKPKTTRKKVKKKNTHNPDGKVNK